MGMTSTFGKKHFDFRLVENIESVENVLSFSFENVDMMSRYFYPRYTRASSADKAGEERYGLCFTSTLSLHLAEEQSITLCAISPSLALIVHTRQVQL